MQDVVIFFLKKSRKLILNKPKAKRLIKRIELCIPFIIAQLRVLQPC